MRAGKAARDGIAKQIPLPIPRFQKAARDMIPPDTELRWRALVAERSQMPNAAILCCLYYLPRQRCHTRGHSENVNVQVD